MIAPILVLGRIAFVSLDFRIRDQIGNRVTGRLLIVHADLMGGSEPEIEGRHRITLTGVRRRFDTFGLVFVLCGEILRRPETRIGLEKIILRRLHRLILS